MSSVDLYTSQYKEILIEISLFKNLIHDPADLNLFLYNFNFALQRRRVKKVN